MKILILAPTLEGGGVCDVVMGYIYSLCNIYSLTICYFDISQENLKKLNQLKIEQIAISSLKKTGFFKFRKQFDKIFKDNHYDIVHLHNDVQAWMVASVAKKYKVKRVVGHAHGQVSSLNKYLIKLLPLFRFLNRKYCDGLIGCSKESIRNMFGVKVKGLIIPNYVSESNLIVFNEEKKLELKHSFSLPKDIILGYAGKLAGQKNPEHLLEIFKKQKMNGYHILFCGACYEKIENAFKENNISEAATFLGYRDDMSELFNIFDIYVCPSYTEGMSMSLIQAQMMGIPCVVSKGVPKINDLGVGLFLQCETYNTIEWKNKIEKAKHLIKSQSVKEISKILRNNKLDENSIINKLTKAFDGDIA